MQQEQVKRMLENYRRCAARRDCLRMEIPMARRQLEREREAALLDAALPGHSLEAKRLNAPGDPTARVAVRFASGYQPLYIREMEGDLSRMQDELRECESVCRYVEAWRGALNEREQLVIDRHVIGGETYAEVMEAFAQRFPAAAITSPEGLKKLNLRAMAKIRAAAGADGAS